MNVIRGDILDVERGYILHQVNASGIAGKGLAQALKLKYPGAFIPYFDFCRSHPDSALGELVFGGTNPRIVHVIGQPRPGPCTDYAAVEKAIKSFSEGNLRRMPVAVPWGMGCGLGGGDWTVYREILEKYLPEATCYRLP